MYSVSTDFRTASRSLVSNAQCMLTVGGQQVRGLTDVTINESLGNAGAFAVGMFVSTSLSFTCLTSSLLPITPSTPINVGLGYMVGGEPEYVPMGEFYSAPKYVSHKNLLSVVQAYDRAWTLSDAFTSSLSYPTKASLIMAEIAEAQDIVVMENEAYTRLAQVTVYEAPTGTIRDAIAGLALLIGCNVQFNRSGELEFLAVNIDATPVESYTEAHYRNDTYTLTSDEPLIYGNVSCTYTYTDTFEDYAEFYIENDGHVYMETEEAVDDDISFTIDENGHLIMTSSDTLYDMFLDEGDLFVTHVATDTEEQDFTKTWTYSAASGSGAVRIETQNIRSQRETDRLGQYIVGASGVTYYGYTVTMFGQPQLDLGDVITVTDPNGEDYDFIVMNMVHNFTGAMTTALSAVVSDEDLSFDGSNLSGSASALAKKAQVAAVQAGIAAGNAQESADTALNLAEGTNEHFWHDGTGAHITQVTQAEYKASPANAGGNTLITSQGMAVRDGTTELASFTGSGAQIGKNASGHTTITEGGMQVWSGSNGTTELAHIGYTHDGVPEGGGSQHVDAPYYSFGARASGSDIGAGSFSEGGNNTASGYLSHAEGKGTQAIGDCAHAEGYYTKAVENYSHAEGNGTEARGMASHASGEKTYADQDNQFAVGRYNKKTPSAQTYDDSLFVVGCGESEATRANAFEVKQNPLGASADDQLPKIKVNDLAPFKLIKAHSLETSSMPPDSYTANDVKHEITNLVPDGYEVLNVTVSGTGYNSVNVYRLTWLWENNKLYIAYRLRRFSTVSESGNISVTPYVNIILINKGLL